MKPSEKVSEKPGPIQIIHLAPPPRFDAVVAEAHLD